MTRVDRFSPAQITAVMTVGIAGVLIAGLQPQLLGALAKDGRLSVAALGHLATVELLAMGVAASLAAFILPVSRIRQVALAALVVIAAADLLTARAGPGAIFAARAAAGLGEGVLIWIAIGLIVRTAHPARWSGIYLMVQTLAQLALATLLTIAVLPAGGSAGGFAALGIVTLLIGVATFWLPRGYLPLGTATTHGAAPLRTRGSIALLGVVLYLAFSVAVWVYVEPLAHQRGVPAAMVAWIAPLSLVMQVLGAGTASLAASRLRALPTLVVIGVANLALLAFMAATTSPILFVTATAVFGFLWLFALPFQMPLVIAADPTRGAAALVGGAQLVGAAAGPFLASLLIRGEDVTAVLWFGAAAIVAAIGASAMALQPRASTTATPSVRQ